MAAISAVDPGTGRILLGVKCSAGLFCKKMNQQACVVVSSNGSMAVSPSSPLTERELQQYAFGIGAFSDNEGLLGQEPIVERLRGFCTGSAHGGGRTAAVWGPRCRSELSCACICAKSRR